MSTAEVSRFLAVLSLLCGAAVVAVIGLLVVRRWAGAWVESLLLAIGDGALWFAAGVAVVCTLGSLYFSEIAGDTPCDLCWFQRICMYPLSAVLVVAAVRKDRDVWRYVVVPALVGTGIAVYHTQLQAFPAQRSFCPTAVPCTIRYVWEFGFVSLPFMALTGFLFILVMMRLTTLRELAPLDDEQKMVPGKVMHP